MQLPVVEVAGAVDAEPPNKVPAAEELEAFDPNNVPAALVLLLEPNKLPVAGVEGVAPNKVPAEDCVLAIYIYSWQLTI